MKQVLLNNIAKTYDKQTTVLHNINVTIEPGEFFVLVGPSGCGKSTMLRMIAGLEDITAGEMYIDQQLVNHLPPVKRDLSMVFQNYALYPHLTVAQNISFGLHAKKTDKTTIQQRIEDVAQTLQLTPYLKRKPRELSGGQRQRVALARAIVSDAKICLMDEPLSNLDAKLRTHMRAEIKQLQRKLGITMIYVTHDQIEAMTMGDRIMILHEGEIQQIGKPIDIYNYPANPFVATFIGSPPMNIATANIQTDGFSVDEQLLIPNQTTERFTKHETLIIGIRPEHITHIKAADTCSLHITLLNIELLGTETIISFIVGNNTWHARWTGQWALEIGQSITIYLPLDAFYYYDAQTGELLKKATTVGHFERLGDL